MMRAKKKSTGTGHEPVYLEDRGAVYDAPLEVVWDFWLKDETYHSHAHTSNVRNFRTKELSKLTTLIRYQALEGGKWRKKACRMTVIRPAVRVQEDLLGPDAGSVKVYVYTPRGSKTVVDVHCWMRSSERTPKQIILEARKTFANAYREDLPWFRKYVASLKGKA
jgi:hypothetical protein